MMNSFLRQSYGASQHFGILGLNVLQVADALANASRIQGGTALLTRAMRLTPMLNGALIG
jgi:hypothetical protein